MTLGRDLQAGFFCVFLLFWLLPSFIPSGEALLIPQADPTPTDGRLRLSPLSQWPGARTLDLFLFEAQLEPNRRASNVCGMNTGGWLPKLVSEGSARSPQVAGGQSLPRQQRQLQEMLMAKELEVGGGEESAATALSGAAPSGCTQCPTPLEFLVAGEFLCLYFLSGDTQQPVPKPLPT